jgi:hypothetical protein
MAKSKPIGVRFDLYKLDMIQKEQNLTSVQQVVNYLMDNYGSKEVKRGAPFKNMPPYRTEAPNLEEIANYLPTPPENLKGLDLAIWKSENWK